jgi:hypothetical protein
MAFCSQNNNLKMHVKALSHYCVSYAMPAYEKYHSYAGKRTLNRLEVRQMYGTHTLAFQRIFVRMKIISLSFIRFSYVSLIRNIV